MIKRAIKSLSYFVLPKRCNLCGEVIELDMVRCEECKSTNRIDGEICSKCGREKDNCQCKKEKFTPNYTSFCAPYYFDGSVKNGVYRLKNSGYIELAPSMSEEIANTVKTRFKGIEFDLVTSVPITKSRLLKRGFNQSELLAKGVAESINAPYQPLLYKKRNTKSQRKSSAKERRINLYGAFDLLDNAEVKDKTILIIDDVKTTGSTLSECAGMLKGYNAKAVYAAAFTVTNKK